MVRSLLPPQTGCFILRIVDPNGISIRSTKFGWEGAPSVESFGQGELIEVDWMEGGNADGGLRTMRLANGSGWFDAAKEGIYESVPVEDGLWIFYSFGMHSSITVLNQPTDRKERRLDQVLWPLQKVFFDKKVTNMSGKTFYRIQGTHDWVRSSKGDHRFLYPELLVTNELKVFKALEDLEVLSVPNDEVSSRTDRKIFVGDLVAVDFTIIIPNKNGTGPFLRLADNSGWLMEQRDNVAVMKEVHVQDGSWNLEVRNHPLGVELASHPIDSAEYFIKTEIHFQPFQRIQCDKKVVASNGVCFYRVRGTNGWVWDRRIVKNDGMTYSDVLEKHPVLVVLADVDIDSEKTLCSDTSVVNETDDEWALRLALKDLESEFWQRRNQLLRKIHRLDAQHIVTAFSRSKNQTCRAAELKVAKLNLEEANAKLAEEQLIAIQRKSLVDSMRKSRGDKFVYEMYCESEIRLDKSDFLFAMGGIATLVVGESGILRYTSGLPYDLVNLLETEKLALPLASTVALGSEDRYFIRFANERMERWCVRNDELEAILMAERADFVAFGDGCASFVVKSPSGFHYNDIPEELEAIINDDRPIHSISLGSSGEFFVAWEDGACTGGNWDGSKINAALDRLKGEGWHVRDIKFGGSQSFIIRYSDYDGPF